jgi:transposase-like protein
MSKHDKTMQTMQIMTVIYARTKHHQPCVGINIKRRRHYPPDMKRAIYALCLERSDPGMMKEGVTKSVATDMGVPWRVV